MPSYACQSTTKGLCSIPGTLQNEDFFLVQQDLNLRSYNPHTMSSALGTCFKNTILLGTLTHFTKSYRVTKNRLPSTHWLVLEVPASFQLGVWSVVNKLLGL